MNADLKRVRETSQDDQSPSKRRAMSLSTPAVPTEYDEDGRDEWQRIVEVKRKEAIYRQMLEYRRMHERERRRANDLEAQKKVLEASVQAVEVCWTQLVTAMRSLTGSEDLTESASQASLPVLDPSLDSGAISQALQTRLPATKQLVTRFVDLSSTNGIQAGVKDLHAKYSDLQVESSALRSKSQSQQSEIATLTKSRDVLERDLIRTQKALDRQRMDHEQAAEEWKLSREREKGSETPGQGKMANGSGHATPNGKVEQDEKPSQAAFCLLPDTTELEEKAESRLKQLEALRAEHTALQQKYDELYVSSSQPSEAVLRESPFFQIYLQQLNIHYTRANDLHQRYEANEKKIDELQSRNSDFHQTILSETRSEVEALRQQITQKNTELVRIRAHRDEVNAELMEKKTKESDRLRYADEMEILAKSREDRIAFLGSEIMRLKGQLGARSGSEGYLAFLHGEGGIDGDYVKSLEGKLQDAQTRLSTMTDDVGEQVADVSSVRAELEILKKTLSTYERILGPDPAVAEDIKELGRKLKEADEERSQLRLQLEQAEEATNALYSEVEGLSKLWEETSQTMKTRVYELKDVELRLSRLNTEKAKANNKYFAAMQAKEISEQETRNATRTVEKQLLLLQKSQEVERSLLSQVASHEKGLTALKNTATELQTQLAAALSDKAQAELRLSQVQSSLATAQKVANQRVAECLSEKSAKDKLQDEADSAARTIKKLKEKHDAMMSSSKNGVSAVEHELQHDHSRLLRVLRCSCCNDKFRNQVITRCMHTFCKECLDSRIASRQRKCPACGVPFAKEEVQTMFFQ